MYRPINNIEYINYLELCYGIKILDNEDNNIILNYNKYNVKESLEYINKLSSVFNTKDNGIKIFLLQSELKSNNPYWLRDLYSILGYGSDIFRYICDGYNNAHLNSIIDKVRLTSKYKRVIKIEDDLKQMFDEIYKTIKHSKLMIDIKSLEYLVIEDKNKVYECFKGKKDRHIGLNIVKKGEILCEPKYSSWNGDLNELDNKINFDTAFLRLSNYRYI